MHINRFYIQLFYAQLRFYRGDLKIFILRAFTFFVRAELNSKIFPVLCGRAARARVRHDTARWSLSWAANNWSAAGGYVTNSHTGGGGRGYSRGHGKWSKFVFVIILINSNTNS